MAPKDKAAEAEVPPPLTIYAAMTKILAEIGPISKNKKNDEQGYFFRGVDAAMDALNPLLGKYGVFPTISNIEERLFEKVVSKR